MRTFTHNNDFLEHMRRQSLTNQAGRTMYFCRDGHLVRKFGVLTREKCKGHINPERARS